ncbi:hypothetical protein [Flectobacillus longus]|uniref:hypothetical protein n=1 Tax=Flectobacillus longus TaxID=2984207 RepID=UPI0024B741C1|nr:hypothetical protein [Flectobacillus longus]MDI9880757.1 hypothetical protein [Flectobacillus longus]
MKNLLLIFVSFIFIAPDDFKTLFNKGMSELDNGHEKEALTYFLQSHKLNKNPKTSYYIAVCFFNLDSLDHAAKYAIEAKNNINKLPEKPYQANIKFILNYKKLTSNTVTRTSYSREFQGTTKSLDNLIIKTQNTNKASKKNPKIPIKDLPNNNYDFNKILEDKGKDSPFLNNPVKIKITKDSI